LKGELHFNVASEIRKCSRSGSAQKENQMKKLLLATAISIAGFTAAIGPSSAMGHSKYCMTNGYDPLCMSPKMMKMRMAMMKMDKATVMKNRTKYCRTSNGSDPICDPKMMHSTMGY
jgi:hypothetical protein